MWVRKSIKISEIGQDQARMPGIESRFQGSRHFSAGAGAGGIIILWLLVTPALGT